MVIWNILEDLRRRENQQRGYVEVKTPLIYDKWLWETSGHWEKFREHMFLIPDGDRTFALKPMNCPGHMRAVRNRLRSYRELPLRLAEAAPLHRNELARDAPRAAARPPRHPGRRASSSARAEQIEDEIYGCLDYAAYLYELVRARVPRSSSRPGPENKLGTDEEWDFTEGALRSALDRRRVSSTS